MHGLGVFRWSGILILNNNIYIYIYFYIYIYIYLYIYIYIKMGGLIKAIINMITNMVKDNLIGLMENK
jgi:hypothetical protein